MAYSDYGGYAYKDGALVLGNSDAYVMPEGVFGSPGAVPHFEIPKNTQDKALSGPHHAVLGDGPIFVCLYKQSTVLVYIRGEKVKTDALQRDWDAEDEDATQVREFEIHDHKITAVHTYGNNYYVYAKMEQSDGVVWEGFSGYQIGAGYNDPPCLGMLEEFREDLQEYNSIKEDE